MQSQQRLKQAKNFEQWQNIGRQASPLDATASKELHYAEGLLSEHTTRMAQLIKQQNWQALSDFLDESLHQTVGELGKPELHQSLNRLVESYLERVTTGLKLLCDSQVPGLSREEKQQRFAQAEHNFGRPALMLSGGGTFGIYHLGVIRVLLEQGLLPEVISGSSMGSIVAGLMAIHTDEELKSLLASPEQSHYQPLKHLPLGEMIRQRCGLDQEQLQACIDSNIGQYTFAEAYKQTGRSVSISVSPTRSGQKPRILNHLTSPDVLISSACKASCSIPGLFPAARLKAKQKTMPYSVYDYLPSETWIDGAFASDIPRQRISRLFNVNYFIVSQANPHILPFISQRQKSGLLATAKDLATTSLVSQSSALIKLAKRRLPAQPWTAWLGHAAQLCDQDYLGDITIHPDFPVKWYGKFMINPSEDELRYLISKGEQATWPQIHMIRNQTRISNTLREVVAHLTKHITFQAA